MYALLAALKVWNEKCLLPACGRRLPPLTQQRPFSCISHTLCTADLFVEFILVLTLLSTMQRFASPGNVISSTDARHVLLFGLHPDSSRLLVFAALSQMGVRCPSACGHLLGSTTPQLQQLRDSNATSDTPAPLQQDALANALGLAHGGGTAQVPPWLQVQALEQHACSASQPTPWYARSAARHALVRSTLLQMLAPGSRLSGDPALIRALFALEATPVLQSSTDGTECMQEAAQAAQQRARTSARRWLQEPMLAQSLAAWSAYAALEEACGKHKQARQVRHCIHRGRGTSSELLEVAVCAPDTHQ